MEDPIDLASAVADFPPDLRPIALAALAALVALTADERRDVLDNFCSGIIGCLRCLHPDEVCHCANDE